MRLVESVNTMTFCQGCETYSRYVWRSIQLRANCTN